MGHIDPLCALEYQRKWRAANRERKRSYDRASRARWSAEKLAERLAYVREWKRNNRLRARSQPSNSNLARRQCDARYRDKNRALLREKDRLRGAIERPVLSLRYRRWARNNPGIVARIRHLRRARIAGSGGIGVTASEWSAILNLYGHKCAYCGTTNHRLTRDHVIPISRGGRDESSNVVPACRSCNSRKHAKLIFPKLIRENLRPDWSRETGNLFPEISGGTGQLGAESNPQSDAPDGSATSAPGPAKQARPKGRGKRARKGDAAAIPVGNGGGIVLESIDIGNERRGDARSDSKRNRKVTLGARGAKASRSQSGVQGRGIAES